MKLLISFLFLLVFTTATSADHNIYDRTYMYSAQWFSKNCDGIEQTELLKKDGREYWLSAESQKKSRDHVYWNNKLNYRWKKSSKKQREASCLRSLILFGPNGKKHKGWLTADPELQKKLPIDIKKDLGF